LSHNLNSRIAATLRVYLRNIVCCRYITVNTLHEDYKIIIIIIIIIIITITTITIHIVT